MVIKKENDRLRITISRKLLQEVKNIADYEGESVSSFMTRLINYYIKNKDNISLD